MDAEHSKTAVIYLRVSSTGQVNKAHDPEGYSIPAQRDACTRYAETIGASVVREFVEPGRSGTNVNRPALQSMLAELPQLRADFVIFYDLSRVARNELDALQILSEIERSGSKLESTTERVDDTPAGKLLYSIMASVNAFRSRGDAEKVMLGIDRKHQAGGSHGPARTGYLNVREIVDRRSIASIAIDPERAPLIGQLFELAATGHYTMTTLTEVMADRGLTSRPNRRKPASPLHRSAIHRILRDDYYLGIVTRNGVKRAGLHQPLVTATTFEKVQAILNSNRLSGDRSQKHTQYLNGSLYCGGCGARMGYGRHKSHTGRYYEYFSCLGRTRGANACDAPYARLDRVEGQIEALHASPVLTATEAELVREAVRFYMENKTELARKESAKHDRRLKQLTIQQQKLLQLYYCDGISDEVMQAEQARIASERSKAIRWKELAETQVEGVMEALNKALGLVSRPAEAYRLAAPHVRKMLNRAIFDRIEVLVGNGNTGVSLQSKWTEKTSLLANVAAAVSGISPGNRRNPGRDYSRTGVRTSYIWCG